VNANDLELTIDNK